MVRFSLHRLAAPLALAAIAILANSSSAATLTPIGPFTGDFSDDFNRFSNVQAVQVLDVFSNHGVIRNLTSGGAIKVEFSSQLNGDLVVPISGLMMGQLGIARWEFNEPVSRFGGWWENNSGADDATATFFDSQGNSLGSMIARDPVQAQTWTWNGWESDVPVKSIQVVGNGLINGFIWYDNVQMTLAVPEPGAIGAMTVASLWLCSRKRHGSPMPSITRS